jgi:SpoVK/Ycf46/Vps4 family AAA+-type ATPase
MRRAIKVAESVAPCILWADELEKSLSGSGSSSYTDGGTASRVFASFLTWMQMKTKPVFLFATANDISAMPPEMIRKGRFDEIFFVDLPSQLERAEIFKIHLFKRGRDSSKFDIPSLVEESDGFTGAEIEAAIVDALYAGFSEQKREINTQDIIVSLSETVPLSVQMKEQVSKLREWARTRARHASVPRQSAIIRSEIAKIKEAPRNTVAAVSYEPDEDEEL